MRRVAQAVVIIDERDDPSDGADGIAAQARGKAAAIGHLMVLRDTVEDGPGQLHAAPQIDRIGDMPLVAQQVAERHVLGAHPLVGRHADLADVVQQGGQANGTQLLRGGAVRLAQQQAQHHDVDRVQGVALAHAFGQQADHRVPVEQQVVHAVGHQRLALGARLQGVLVGRRAQAQAGAGRGQEVPVARFQRRVLCKQLLLEEFGGRDRFSRHRAGGTGGGRVGWHRGGGVLKLGVAARRDVAHRLQTEAQNGVDLLLRGDAKAPQGKWVLHPAQVQLDEHAYPEVGNGDFYSCVHLGTSRRTAK